MKFTCPNCGQHLDVDEDEFAGVEFNCPKCSQLFEFEAPTLESVKDAAAKPPPIQASKARVASCSKCNKTITTSSNKCPKCGNFLRVRAADTPSNNRTETLSTTKNESDLELSPGCAVLGLLLGTLMVVGGFCAACFGKEFFYLVGGAVAFFKGIACIRDSIRSLRNTKK